MASDPFAKVVTRRPSKSVDECRARHCGGLLVDFDSGDIADGSMATCSRCGRAHFFSVYDDGGPVYVRIEKKRYSRKGAR